MTRSSLDLANEIALRMLGAQLYPEQMCRVEHADYRYRIELLVTEFGEALNREIGPLTEREAVMRDRLLAAVAERVPMLRAMADPSEAAAAVGTPDGELFDAEQRDAA